MRGKAYGSTITEYSILLALVGVVGVTSLMSLGGSLSNLLGEGGISGYLGRLATSANRSTEPAALNGGHVALNGSGFYMLSQDPVTGEAQLIPAAPGGSISNATSVEGEQWSAEGSTRLADALEQLAQTQSDPDSSAWMQEMAKLAYYQGGAESLLDGQSISPFDPALLASNMNGQAYGNANAVTDIRTYQAQLQNLMENVPPGVSAADRTQALALAGDAYNIAQSYSNNFATAVDPNIAPGGAPFDTLLNLDTLKADAQARLAANQVNSTPVRAVLSDAVALEGK